MFTSLFFSQNMAYAPSFAHPVFTKIKAIDHSMSVSGFSCTPVASISVISVVLSGY